MSESSPEHPNFTDDQIHSICLAIDHLRQFTEGYLHTKRLDEDPRASSHLRLFMSSGLITYLDGLYESRKSGVLPILRLVGFNKAANMIEVALDTPIGPRTYGQILRILRNKNVAHPQFRPELFAELVQASHDIEASGDEFRNADRELKTITAGLYPIFQKHFPQLVEQTDRWLRSVEGVDHPPSPSS